MRKLALILSLSLLGLTACTAETPEITTEEVTEVSTQTLFTSDFGDACSGIAVTDAAAYSDVVGTHPVLLFGREDSTESFSERSFTLPEEWQVEWQEAAKYELVTCVTTTPKELSESCAFDVEGAEYTLEEYSADYEVNLYAAQTGLLLANTMISLPADECPSIHFFSGYSEKAYPDYVQPLTEFLKPYVQK